MTTELDRAAENHTSFKVKSRKPSVGKIVYNKIDGKTHINVVNSPIGYNPSQLQDFGEMIGVLQAEGKLPTSGSIAVSDIGQM